MTWVQCIVLLLSAVTSPQTSWYLDGTNYFSTKVSTVHYQEGSHKNSEVSTASQHEISQLPYDQRLHIVRGAALFSEEETQSLQAVGVVKQPSVKIFEKILDEDREKSSKTFHYSRTPHCLYTQWQILHKYKLLDGQEVFLDSDWKKRAKIESVWVRVSITHTGPSSQGDFLTHVFSLLYFLCVYVLALVFMAVKVWRGSRPTREAKTPWESLLSVGVLQVPHPAHSEHHQDVACVRIDDRELIVSIFNFALLTRKILDWPRTRSSRSMEPKEDFETRVTDSSTTKLFGWRLKSVRRFGGRLHKLWNFEHSWYNYNRPRRKCRPRS